jgi:hypothetical protein
VCTDPWGDLVNYFRDLNVTQVKFHLLADIVNELSEQRFAAPIGQQQAFRLRA